MSAVFSGVSGNTRNFCSEAIISPVSPHCHSSGSSGQISPNLGYDDLISKQITDRFWCVQSIGVAPVQQLPKKVREQISGVGEYIIGVDNGC